MLIWLTNRMLRLQALVPKIHPTFAKAIVSIIIGFLIFQQMWFGSDEAAKYIEPVKLWWLNWILGSIAIIFNQFRDALSAYYGDKKPDGTENAKDKQQ